MVPFGRTEVSIVPNDAPFRELSHGQALGGICFHGVIYFQVFFKCAFDCFCDTVFMELQSENTRIGFGRADIPFVANGTGGCVNPTPPDPRHATQA